MKRRRSISLALSLFLLLSVLALLHFWPSGAAAQTSSEPVPSDDAELARLFAEDQSDRMPPDGKPIDWVTVAPRDRAREARIKEVYANGQLQTGADYFHAAMILQHAPTPEDCLLAHEFCVVAIMKGDARANWLAAASEDRYLMKIGRPQRFGTQYRSAGPGTPVELYQMDSAGRVTDFLRAAYNVPPIGEDGKPKERSDDTAR